MPPIAQRLREPAAFVLLALGAISTLFHTITFLFAPGQSDNGFGGAGTSFSYRAYSYGTELLNPVVIGALVGAVMLAHVQSHLKTAKVLSLVALITVGVAALFGLVALFAAFGADGVPGWDKTQNFFVVLAQLAVAGVAAWLILGYFQQHGPARPAPGYGQQPPAQQWGQPPQQQWQPPQTQAPAPGAWGPPPAQQAPVAPPQQWGQPQPPIPPQGAPGGGSPDAMMTQAIPTVPPAAPGAGGPQDGGGSLPVGNWTSD